MTSLQSNAAHQKLSSMKRKLYQDGYRFPIDVESLPLVEKLYSDLVRARENLKKAEMNPNEVTSTSTPDNERADVYRNENIRLIKENSELHNQLVKMQTASESSLLELKMDIKKLERENSELKFLNSQYAHQMKALEIESSQKSERILHLQEKDHPASILVGGGVKKKFSPFKKQRIELTGFLPPPEPRPPRAESGEPEDQKVLDLLRVAENTMARLRLESTALRSEVENLRNKVDSSEKQLEVKDKEISRLMRFIEGGEPSEFVVLEAKNRCSQKTISNLNGQIDWLQKQVGDLETQVGRRKVAWDEDGGGERRRKTRINEMDHLMEAKLGKHLEENREEINRLNAELVSKERELRRSLQLEAEQKKEVDDLILKLQEEKVALAAKVAEMTTNEKELVLELNKLKHQKPKTSAHAGSKRTQGKSATPPAPSPSLKAVEEERNYYKGEVDTLLRVLSTVSLHRSQGQRSASPRSQKSMSRATSPLNKNCSCCGGDAHDESEVARLREERDELRGVMENYDKYIKELQSNIKVLTHERDHLSTLYNKTRGNLDERLGSDRGNFESSYAPQSGVEEGGHSRLRRLEEEKEEALAKVRDLRHERDELLKEIRDMDDVVRDERGRYERTITELKTALDDSNREELHRRSSILRPENQIDHMRFDLREQLRMARDEASQHKATASQMKQIADQAEEELKERDVVLVSLQSELRAARMKLEETERRVEREKTSREEEVEKLRRALEKMDRERDELQMETDMKAEAQAKLMESQRSRDKQLRELQSAIQESESALSKMKTALLGKDRELIGLKRQVETLTEDLKFTRKLKEGLVAENRKIQEEAENVSRDAQIVTKDLNEAIRMKNKLSGQAQEYLNEVKRCQELLTSKEQEKYDILEQYRMLNSDLERAESTNLALEGEVSRLRIEVLNKEAEARRLGETQERADKAIQDRTTAERNYILQISGLSKNVSSLEENLQRLEVENRTLGADLNAARGFVSRLEAERSQLERQLSVRSFDNEKLQALVDCKRKEAEMLKQELEGAKRLQSELEASLQAARTKEWQAQMALQEKQSEAQLLKDRLALNDHKIENQSKELSYHRSKVVEMDAEVEKLKRQIISEKFERERLMQALRVNDVSLPEDSRLGAISPERAADGSGDRLSVKDDAATQIFKTM